jgi:hypothetical protein
MKLSRERAKELCTKSQYGEASFWELVQLNIHVLLFKECAQFSSKNAKLTSLCEEAELQVLSEEDKKAMKKCLDEES